MGRSRTMNYTKFSIYKKGMNNHVENNEININEIDTYGDIKQFAFTRLL